MNGSGGIHIDSTHSYSNGEASATSSTSSVLPSPTTIKDNNNNNNQNADTVHQMSTHSNISRNSAFEHEMHAEGSNEITELIIRCLRICGEEDGLLPLFKVVFATLADLPDNRYTLRLDGRGRDILLTGIITRMIRHVSEHVGLVFISDDVQCKCYMKV